MIFLKFHKIPIGHPAIRKFLMFLESLSKLIKLFCPKILILGIIFVYIFVYGLVLVVLAFSLEIGLESNILIFGMVLRLDFKHIAFLFIEYLIGLHPPQHMLQSLFLRCRLLLFLLAMLHGTLYGLELFTEIVIEVADCFELPSEFGDLILNKGGSYSDVGSLREGLIGHGECIVVAAPETDEFAFGEMDEVLGCVVPLSEAWLEAQLVLI